MFDNERIKELQDLVNQPVKNITYEGQMTIVEFENGQILPLYGGGGSLDGTVNLIKYCAFCGNEGTDENPVVSLNPQDDPLICPSCVSKAMQVLIENGIDMEIDISKLVPQDVIEKILDK